LDASEPSGSSNLARLTTLSLGVDRSDIGIATGTTQLSFTCRATGFEKAQRRNTGIATCKSTVHYLGTFRTAQSQPAPVSHTNLARFATVPKGIHRSDTASTAVSTSVRYLDICRAADISVVAGRSNLVRLAAVAIAVHSSDIGSTTSITITVVTRHIAPYWSIRWYLGGGIGGG
jgi:hypothetical protein